MLSTDYAWYRNNLRSLHEKYGDKYIAIKDETVLGSYDSYIDGVEETSKTLPLGTFIIQRCGADESAYTCHISSMNFVS